MAYTSSSSFSPTSSRSSFLRPFSPKVLEHISTPSTVSCKATNDLDPKKPTTRRDVLLGLGGLYYASSTLCDASANDAKAVSAVDRTGRGRGDLGPGTAAPAAETKNMVLTATSAFPLDLDKVVSTEVSRPRKSRSKKEKEDEEEVLVIEGIDFERGEFVKFDVYVNDDGDPSPRGPNKAEFAGSFANVPHTSRTKGNKASLTLAINELLNNLEAEDDDSVVVTLVPRSGKGPVIGGVKIEYVKE